MASHSPALSAVSIRRARKDDAPASGKICYEAFSTINAAHGFPFDFPGPEPAIGLLGHLFSHPRFYGVVAESDGQVIGSNCLDERSAIAGIGPITVDPNAQARRVGRVLMNAVLDRAKERNFPGVRLVQAAFNRISLSLYTSLGFQVREPLVVLQGSRAVSQIDGYRVRPAQPADVEECNQLCRRVHGHDRSGELVDAIGEKTAVVAECRGRIVAYAGALGFFGHAVAEDNTALQALIASAETFSGPGILVPTRNAVLFRWCLESGLRIVEPMNLMTIGLYNEPAGAWLPSILY